MAADPAGSAAIFILHDFDSMQCQRDTALSKEVSISCSFAQHLR